MPYFYCVKQERVHKFCSQLVVRALNNCGLFLKRSLYKYGAFSTQLRIRETEGRVPSHIVLKELLSRF